jgi:hypothetical protein
MASNQYLTLKDMTALDYLADPGSVGLVDNIVNVAPELERVMGRPIKGISYPATIMTAIGSNAGFRKVNSGVALSAFSIDTKRFSCFPFDCQMSVDEALLIERQAEAGESPAFIFTTHATAAARQKALTIGKQFYQGSLNDPNGPMGLLDFLTMQRTQVDSRTGLKINQVVDAGGVTAGACEQVWFIKQGQQGVHWLFGNGRGIVMNPWLPFNIGSPDSTANNPKVSRQWRSNLFGYLGTSMAQVHAVGLINNVNATPTIAAGVITFPNGLTDALVSDLWHLWPITMKPDLCFATQNAIFSLQISRSVTNFVNSGGREWTKGAAPFADWPTTLPTAGGIPIIATDSIVPGNQLILN